MNIKGAIFDMDGTLIDSLSFGDHLWSSIGARYMNDPHFKVCEEVDKAVGTMIYTDAMVYVIDTVLSCADIGVGKDRPDIYPTALREMGLTAGEVCVFEDSYIALETARKVGFQTVGIYDRYNFEQERLKATSDFYLAKGYGLNALIGLCAK